ncbi:MAG: hypothetical protein A2V67_04855 [Deltaproteobacteria bacterium RBG_13_61_14]|nr:MAG: hypothetical protein A2V67_04855 [Deltaproteobacteria bacterium RBG_13_61_14]
MYELLAALRLALETDATLKGYVEIVRVCDYNETALPAFTNYAIVVSPAPLLMKRNYNAINEWQDEVNVQIVALIGKFNQHQEALISQSETSPGLLKMMNHIYDCLHFNALGGVIELTGNELSGQAAIGGIGEHYYTAMIPFKGLLQSFVE